MCIYRATLWMIVQVSLTGCLSARIDPEVVRKERPAFYKQWIERLRKNGTSDDELKKLGFKEPGP
jgi:hypothetical protein